MIHQALGQEEEREIDAPLIRQERDLEMAASGIKGAAAGGVVGFKGGKVIKQTIEHYCTCLK